MKRKGFTLIELLAVIVILAIIALIATPIILGIVEDARKDSFMRSVELVVDTTDIDIFSKDYNYVYTIKDGVVSNLEVGIKNTEGMNGNIVYDTKGLEQYAIYNGKYCVIKTSSMTKAEIKDYVEGECELIIPTDASYFTYVDILSNFRIVDVDACVEVLFGLLDEDEAISACNNEQQGWPWGGRALTEYANNYPYDYWILSLVEAGAISGNLTNTIAITGYSEEGPKNVIIPSRIKGKEVISIGQATFAGLGLTSVGIPNTITLIDNAAFANNLLQEVTIPRSVEYIEESAFIDNSLRKVNIENNNIEIGECTFAGNPFAADETSVSYQKIYSINPNALMRQTSE